MRITITKGERIAICYRLNNTLKHKGLTTPADVHTQHILEKLKCYRR